jgi:hypothetical protein
MNEQQSTIIKYQQCGRAFLDAAVPLLKSQRAAAPVDLHEPVADEVVGGLFARIFRFLQSFLLDYHLWADDLGCVVRRMMLESLFYMRFLIKHNQAEMFMLFQTYGIGQEKLYKLQLRKLLEEGQIEETESLRDYIDSDSDEEIADELLKISLKNFENLRTVATDADMKKDYVLYYQPYSTFIHGHWPSLRLFYLEQCQETLHRSHLQPSFSLPGLDPTQINHAFGMFQEAYAVWIERYKLEDVITPLIEKYFAACLASDQPEPSGSTAEATVRAQSDVTKGTE